MSFTVCEDKRIQENLVGEPLRRAQAILNLPQGNFDLTTLITKENLKRVDFLSERIGSIIPFQRFINGIPVKSLRESDEHCADGESINDDAPSEPGNVGGAFSLNLCFLCYVHY